MIFDQSSSLYDSRHGAVKIIYINVNEELNLIQHKLLCKKLYFNVLIVIIEFY